MSDIRQALIRVLPFAKAFAVQQKCIGRNCPFCQSIREAEAALNECETQTRKAEASPQTIWDHVTVKAMARASKEKQG